MGHRLSKIVTRTGDTGTTGLASGERVAKTDVRIQAMGDVDELNSQIGVLLSLKPPRAIAGPLTRIQHELFNLGGELALPGAALVTDADVAALEADVAAFNARLPPLKEFVLPGGPPAAAAAHLARAICRRAERALWAVDRRTGANAAALRYLNRLSDLLFVLARTLARRRGRKEIIWARG
ncbi:MAG: cob(I)yrinic acid a,c-diamide adenosyltransferase [Gammaproteobacteria bacterium]|nr:cob(I)yrinic acid a,c-diamide adenosyltransferase [Gammaproteobacteria bacterium]